jgi:hypothetical protein
MVLVHCCAWRGIIPQDPVQPISLGAHKDWRLSHGVIDTVPCAISPVKNSGGATLDDKVTPFVVRLVVVRADAKGIG